MGTHSCRPPSDGCIVEAAANPTVRASNTSEERCGVEEGVREETATGVWGDTSPAWQRMEWIPERREELEDAGDVWPEWWGNMDEVGRSPFDHAPGPVEGERRRVLFLTGESRPQ